MPLAKNDPQAYGSALTYARRYGLSSMVGLVTEDDDAQIACAKGITYRNQNQGNKEAASPCETVEKSKQNVLIDNLPKIDGIKYQQQKAKDGSVYVIASGNTRNKNSILKEAGFKWNASRKIWWKAA